MEQFTILMKHFIILLILIASHPLLAQHNKSEAQIVRNGLANIKNRISVQVDGGVFFAPRVSTNHEAKFVAINLSEKVVSHDFSKYEALISWDLHLTTTYKGKFISPFFSVGTRLLSEKLYYLDEKAKFNVGMLNYKVGGHFELNKLFVRIAYDFTCVPYSKKTNVTRTTSRWVREHHEAKKRIYEGEDLASSRFILHNINPYQFGISVEVGIHFLPRFDTSFEFHPNNVTYSHYGVYEKYADPSDHRLLAPGTIKHFEEVEEFRYNRYGFSLRLRYLLIKCRDL